MTEVDDEDENNLAFDNIVGSDVDPASFALRANYNIPIMSAAQFIIGVGAVLVELRGRVVDHLDQSCFPVQLRCQRSGWYSLRGKPRCNPC